MTDLSEATSIKLDMSLDDLIGAENIGGGKNQKLEIQRKKRKNFNNSFDGMNGVADVSSMVGTRPQLMMASPNATPNTPMIRGMPRGPPLHEPPMPYNRMPMNQNRPRFPLQHTRPIYPHHEPPFDAPIYNPASPPMSVSLRHPNVKPHIRPPPSMAFNGGLRMPRIPSNPPLLPTSEAAHTTVDRSNDGAPPGYWQYDGQRYDWHRGDANTPNGELLCNPAKRANIISQMRPNNIKHETNGMTSKVGEAPPHASSSSFPARRQFSANASMYPVRPTPPFMMEPSYAVRPLDHRPPPGRMMRGGKEGATNSHEDSRIPVNGQSMEGKVNGYPRRYTSTDEVPPLYVNAPHHPPLSAEVPIRRMMRHEGEGPPLLSMQPPRRPPRHIITATPTDGRQEQHPPHTNPLSPPTPLTTTEYSMYRSDGREYEEPQFGGGRSAMDRREEWRPPRMRIKRKEEEGGGHTMEPPNVVRRSHREKSASALSDRTILRTKRHPTATALTPLDGRRGIKLPTEAAEHQKAAARQERGFDVIVTNVPRNLSAAEIQEAFCCLGEVVRTDILLTSHGEHTGRVSVMYSNRHAAEEAVCRFDGGDLNGNTIRVFME